MPNVSHFKITQASLISALTFIVGQIVAYVPSFGPDKQNIIAAGSALISAAFLGANAVHKLADSNVSAKDVEQGAIAAGQAAARDEIGKVDLNQIASQAVAGKIPDVPSVVRSELQSELRRLFGEQATPAAAPAVPPAAA